MFRHDPFLNRVKIHTTYQLSLRLSKLPSSSAYRCYKAKLTNTTTIRREQQMYSKDYERSFGAENAEGFEGGRWVRMNTLTTLYAG